MDEQQLKQQVTQDLIALRVRLMASPPHGASRERVLSHYAGLVGEALTGIDAIVEKLTS